MLDVSHGAASFFADLQLYSQYAAAAYCSGNTDSPGQKVRCPIGNCPIVEALDTKTILGISK
jgi:Lipase 3 N-terminal region